MVLEGSGGGGDSGRLLVCSSCCSDADLDIAEAVEAGNTTIMMTNQTANGNITGTDSTSWHFFYISSF